MQSKPLATLLYSTGGVIALLAVLVAGNFIVSAFNLRADLTEGDVYTLSPGTRKVLARLEAPVKLRLYYSQGSEAVPVGLKTYEILEVVFAFHWSVLESDHLEQRQRCQVGDA